MKLDSIFHHMRDIGVTLESDVTVTCAAQIMARERTSGILVERSGVPAGFLTEADICAKVVARELDPRATKVAEVMAVPLITMEGTQSMQDALLCMRQHSVRQVLVTQNGNIVGILKIKDIAAYLSSQTKADDPITEFWDKYDTLLEGGQFVEAVDQLLHKVQAALPEASPVAQAIRRKESYEKIAQLADKEGLPGLTQVLALVEQ